MILLDCCFFVTKSSNDNAFVSVINTRQIFIVFIPNTFSLQCILHCHFTFCYYLHHLRSSLSSFSFSALNLNKKLLVNQQQQYRMRNMLSGENCYNRGKCCSGRANRVIYSY
ncbi:uncharacterized protein LOC142318490 [Lycorma delicatula]|uniref:uncharacterized protein LOC142318490 n=1 Tax=Lycorma delicatula TaxID=130591 RepID=UPI003F519798